MQRKVSRQGIITSIEEKQIKVTILSESACAACHAKGACTMADVSEKEIVVKVENTNIYKKGDRVWVEMPEKQGAHAIFWAYILPLLVLVASLFLLSGKMNEGLIGAGALLFLILYYLILWLMRPVMDKKYLFTLRTVPPEELSQTTCSFNS
ncbi:MAG: SoxR reducing system RseC family protein [Bacteroidales bacterium]|nr:SoxR reducing system RseC family protein [Bacteroidales bacterium]